MFSMFEIIFWFLVMWIVSYICFHSIRGRDLGPFGKFIDILAFLGVIIHELSHLAFCKLFGVETEGISVKYRYRGQANPHGHVSTSYPGRVSFLQGFLIAFAPLFVSTWVAFQCLSMLFIASIEPLVWLVFLFLLISLILGASPSSTDVRYAVRRFQADPKYSLYQVGLVFISGFICWAVIVFYQINLLSDILYYASVVFVYFLLKYSIKGLSKFIHSINSEERSEVDYTTFVNTAQKSASLYKIEADDALW